MDNQHELDDVVVVAGEEEIWQRGSLYGVSFHSRDDDVCLYAALDSRLYSDDDDE